MVEDAAGDVHVIDPGWPSEENWRTLEDRLTAVGKRVTDVATVVATHLHPDHLGLAARLRDASGAQLILQEREIAAAHELQRRTRTALGAAALDEWGVPDARRDELDIRTTRAEYPAFPQADVTVADAELLPIPGRRLTSILTAGHTPGHMCIRSEQDSVILTGDHVLPTVHAGLGIGGSTSSNPIADYLRGLERLTAFDDHEVAPGHEYRFRGLAERCATSAQHHLRRTREVAAIIEAQAAHTVWEVASRLTWTAGWENLVGFYVVSALTQTQMHLDFVRSGQADRYLA